MIEGDCREVMAAMEPWSVDAMVTDPPAGISFMGRTWDHDHGGRSGWVQSFAHIFQMALRVMKPGAHAFVWALPRTSHWTATALEDAGFEIRDVVTHLFGQGFPKSRNLGDGWGTALKPAAEFWILARAPLARSSVTANHAAFGTGGLNVDGGRLDNGPVTVRFTDGDKFSHMRGNGSSSETGREEERSGRWPPNVAMDERAAQLLDESVGERPAGGNLTGEEPTASGFSGPVYGDGLWRQPFTSHADREGEAARERRYTLGGGTDFAMLPGQRRATVQPSRFFYCPKADRAERDVGMDGAEERPLLWSSGTQNPGAFQSEGTKRSARNDHPTVKPIALMRWLCRLVTPPGGTVLDPFTGSGTTGIAALAEGFSFVGVERDAHYCDIARRRIGAGSPQEEAVV